METTTETNSNAKNSDEIEEEQDHAENNLKNKDKKYCSQFYA